MALLSVPSLPVPPLPPVLRTVRFAPPLPPDPPARAGAATSVIARVDAPAKITAFATTALALILALEAWMACGARRAAREV
ncbi:MAG TPA: hypothetical protein VGO34_10720 [Alphaproteobacteria bacterium]